MTTALEHQDQFLAFRKRMAELQAEVAKVCYEVRNTQMPRGAADFRTLDGRLFEYWNRYIDHLGYAADRCIPGEGRLGWVRVPDTTFNYVCYCCRGLATNGWYIPQNIPNAEFVFCTNCKENRLA